VAAASLLVSVLHWNVALVMLLAMCAGVAWKFCGGATPAVMAGGAGVAVPPLSRRARAWAALGGAAALALVTVSLGSVFWTFVKFGCLGFGGGFVLVPLYLQTFVGETAQFLQIPAEEFSNLMALTQATPGPVSVNAATFFGFRMAGVAGAAVATVALLLPSFFLLTAALGGIERWKASRFVQGLLWGVRPATNALMIQAATVFAGMSAWHGGFRPFACALAVFAAAAFLSRRLSVMATIFLCAAFGVLGSPFG
jgi:chromate transporter